jgi:hypothetical protein
MPRCGKDARACNAKMSHSNKSMAGKTLSWITTSIVVAFLLFIGVVLVSVVSCVATGSKSAEEKYFRNWLSADPRVEKISFQGYDDGFGIYKIISASFSIRDKPNSHVTLLRDRDNEFSSLRILQIGDVCPEMLEWDSHVNLWSPRSPNLGVDTKYRPPSPWKEMTLSQLVTDYDKVVEYFSKWSTAPNGEAITTDGGLKVHCRVDPANASHIKQFVPQADTQ